MLNSTEIKWLTSSEQTEYKNLIASRPQNLAFLQDGRTKLFDLTTKIRELTNINLNLELEKAKLQKSYNDMVIINKASNELLSQSTIPIIKTTTNNEEKKSNLGMILGVAALGVGAYLYTKE
jgi:hypothetical protein